MSEGAVAGSCEFHLSTYAGLHVGDVLELDPGLPTAEAVTIVKFGSVFTASPLRFDHARGAQVRRLIEGTGPSRSTPAEQEYAQRQRALTGALEAVHRLQSMRILTLKASRALVNGLRGSASIN